MNQRYTLDADFGNAVKHSFDWWKLDVLWLNEISSMFSLLIIIMLLGYLQYDI